MDNDDSNMLSVEGAAGRLGFSPQHAQSLIEAGELEAIRPPNEASWKVPMGVILDFEQRRLAAEHRAEEFSRALDDAGAPPE